MVIWEFTKYRPYLTARLGESGSRTGRRKELAAYIPVHTTLISQVLSERAELSLEQAERVNSFMQHTQDEGEYFLLLVMKDRAGSTELKNRFKKQIEKMRQARLKIADRVQAESEISKEDREKFYSTYIYGALHVLASIPNFQTVEQLASALHLPRPRTQEMVDFLLRLGVLKLEKGQLSPGSRHVHLGNDSDLILKHHSNWRLHTINHLQYIVPEDLHYSACASLSEKDAFAVKEKLLKTLSECLKTIAQSKEEAAYVLNFDFYRMLSGVPAEVK